MNISRLTLVLAASLTLWVGRASAQELRTDSIHHRNECRLARQVVVDGHPHNKFEWALDVLPTCDSDGGEALALLVRRYRTTTAAAEWEPLVDAAGSMRDAAVYQAALALATSAGAPPAPRVHAMRILGRLADPGDVTPYAQVVAVGRSYHANSTDQSVFDGTPLPAEWKTAASIALRQVAESATSAEVRAAANRVSGDLRAIARIERLCPRGTSREECTRRRTTMP